MMDLEDLNETVRLMSISVTAHIARLDRWVLYLLVIVGLLVGALFFTASELWRFEKLFP